MAKELAYRVWVNDSGKQVLWAEKDHNGNKTNHLTKEQEQRYISGIFKNKSGYDWLCE